VALVALALVLGVGARPALADRAEAQWSVRSVFGAAQFHEEGSSVHPLGLVAGLSLAVSFGLSNRLDVGAELLALAPTKAAAFTDVTSQMDGAIIGGRFLRRSGSTLLLLGPTWRFGVAWVPVVSVSGGGGMRTRADGTFFGSHVSPPERRGGTVLDLAMSAKVGIEHRFGAHLTAGAYVVGLVAWSPEAPVLPALSGSLGVSLVNYPGW
jgi:hypothetical protein